MHIRIIDKTEHFFSFHYIYIHAKINFSAIFCIYIYFFNFITICIESARANPIRLTTDCFSIAVKDSEGKSRYFSLGNGGVQILDAENSRIEQKKPVTLHLAAANFPKLQDGDTVLFQYIPIRENSEFSMTWEITKEVYDEFIANQSTSKN